MMGHIYAVVHSFQRHGAKVLNRGDFGHRGFIQVWKWLRVLAHNRLNTFKILRQSTLMD